MNTNPSISAKPLRVWPGVALAALLILIRFVPPLVHPEGGLVAVLGAAAAGVLIFLWWLLLSRAPWSERVGAILLIVAAVYATRLVIHASIRGGMMGYMLPMYLALPWTAFALVVWAAGTNGWAQGARRLALVAVVLITCASFAIIRTDGTLGATSQITWRWTPTAEERLLAKGDPDPIPPAPAATPTAPPEQAPVKADAALPSSPAIAKATAPIEETHVVKPTEPAMPVAWPGFRGPARDSNIHGVRIETDWTKSPPVPMWRRPIGPGWSSFAVAGDLIFTQEQRGDDEIVAAYRLATGEPVWRHRDAARFYESNGRPGPRGTPTLHGGRVYTLGATGILNALDARTGAVLWSRNAVKDTGATIPGWGITSSPLIVGDTVVVATSGRLASYELATGKLRWMQQTGGGGYSSPHLVTLDGVGQIVLVSGGGAVAVSPADGKVLWKNPLWQDAVGIVQPATVDGDVVFAAGDAMGGIGMRRVSVTHASSGWTATERWTSRGLKPYFNDFVVHKGYAYGYDGSILSCIDIKDGTRKWKGGRYGAGQLVLLADQDLLLVISEEGELALVKAVPDEFVEVVPKTPAIEGKTWNHPVVIGDQLLVRNGEEMAAFRLPRARETQQE
jgi:outer membrane protein assembly factor BamB